MSERDESAATISRVEASVWRVLGKRGWFGKHVEEEEMDALERDLRAAIEEAVRADA